MIRDKEPWKNLLSLSRATTIMRLKTPRNKKEPKLLVHVLHALADLKDARGSTLRKITDQVQIAINLSRTKPKPKNVLGQVRRALRHGVQTGVLKHRAGKFRLATATEINHALKRSVGRRSARKKAIITGKRKKRVRRRRSRRHYSKLNNLHSSPTEENVLQQSYNNYSNIADQQQSVPEMDHPTYVMARRRRKRNPEKRRRKKSGRRKKRRRDFDKAVNLDGNPYGDDDIRNHRNSDYGGMVNYMQPKDYHTECDNPECLCNLGQEHHSGVQNDEDVYDNHKGGNPNYMI